MSSTDARRITAAVSLPLLVDIDTGWGHAFNIARTVREMARAGVAAVISRTRWRPSAAATGRARNWSPTAEMCDRIKAAVDAKPDAAFVVMARTDAAAEEGVEAAIARAQAYVAAGADMIFAEALTHAGGLPQLHRGVPVPVLANLTEFGKTPLFTWKNCGAAGVAMALYPLSAFRAMSRGGAGVYAAHPPGRDPADR